MLDDSESIISDHISHLPSHVNALPNYQLGPPPSLPAPECFMPNQAHYFTVGSSVSGANDPNYYVIEKPMSMMSNAGLPHLQKASSKSSTTSKSCSSTESQKYMIKNLIQQTNHSKLNKMLPNTSQLTFLSSPVSLKNGDKNSKSSSNSSSKGGGHHLD